MFPWEIDSNKYGTIFHANNPSNSQVMKYAGISSLDNCKKSEIIANYSFSPAYIVNNLQGGQNSSSLGMLDLYNTNKVNYAQDLQYQVQETENKKRHYLESDRKSDWAMLKYSHDHDPFGRPGAGAPIRDQWGNIITTRKKDPFYVNNPLYYHRLKNDSGDHYKTSYMQNYGVFNNKNDGISPNINYPQSQYQSPSIPVHQISSGTNAQVFLTPQILPSQQKAQPFYHPNPQIQQQFIQQQLLQQQILQNQQLLQQAQSQSQPQAQAQAQTQNTNYLTVPTTLNVPTTTASSFLQHNSALTERKTILSQSQGPPPTGNERTRRIKADLDAQYSLVKLIEENRRREQELRLIDLGVIVRHNPHEQREEEHNHSFHVQTTESEGQVEPEPKKTKYIPPELDEHISKMISGGLQEFKEKLSDEQKSIYKQMDKLKKRRNIADKDLEDFRFLLRHHKEKHDAPLTQPPLFEREQRTAAGNYLDDDDDEESRLRRRRYWLEGEGRYDSLLDKYNPYSQQIAKKYGLSNMESNPGLENYDFEKYKESFNRVNLFAKEPELERGSEGIRVDDFGGRYNLPEPSKDSQMISSLPIPTDRNPEGAVNIFRKNQERLDAIDKTERDYRNALNKSRKGRASGTFFSESSQVTANYTSFLRFVKNQRILKSLNLNSMGNLACTKFLETNQPQSSKNNNTLIFDSRSVISLVPHNMPKDCAGISIIEPNGAQELSGYMTNSLWMAINERNSKDFNFRMRTSVEAAK